MKVSSLVDVPKSALSSGFPRSILRMSLPWRSWRISPAVTIGPIPSSVSVPCEDAKITLRNANWSCLVAEVEERGDPHHHVDDERAAGPDELLAEGWLLHRLRYLWEDCRNALDDIA